MASSKRSISSANCISRAWLADRMRPKFGDARSAIGNPKFAWFATLNTSARNCSRTVSFNPKVLQQRNIDVGEARPARDVSPGVAELARFGGGHQPSEWRAADPGFHGARPAVRIADQIRPAGGVAGDRRARRLQRHVRRVVDGEGRTGVRGHDAVDCHPPSSAPPILHRRPKGISHRPLPTKRCRASNNESPRSALQIERILRQIVLTRERLRRREIQIHPGE